MSGDKVAVDKVSGHHFVSCAVCIQFLNLERGKLYKFASDYVKCSLNRITQLISVLKVPRGVFVVV